MNTPRRNKHFGPPVPQEDAKAILRLGGMFIVIFLLGTYDAVFWDTGGLFCFWAVALYVLLLSSPILFLVYRRAVSKKIFGDVVKPKSGGCFVTFAVGLSIICTVISINRFMDNAPAEKNSYTVIDAAFQPAGRHHYTDTYSVYFLNPGPSSLPYASHLTDSADISRQDYSIAIPGKTMITLVTHKGFLGFPWHEYRYTLSSITPPSS